MDHITVKTRLSEDAELIEKALCEYLADCGKWDPEIGESMRYSVLGGGKRIRGVLALEFCRLFCGDIRLALPHACAAELMHASSLVHDDMPEMDNDDMRRGKPSCHKRFGLSTALLTGDALICLAFDILASENVRGNVKSVSELAKAGGTDGIISGQMLDIASEGSAISFDSLLTLQKLKTGKLMRCSALLGAYAAGADKVRCDIAEAYASNVGLAFQIIDDVLDSEESGSDSRRDLATFLKYMNADDARDMAGKLTDEAKRAVSGFQGSEFLCGLADYLLERKY